MTFNSVDGEINMLKSNGVYCFLYVKQQYKKKQIYLLNGGQLNKLVNQDINYYFGNLPKYANNINGMLKTSNDTLKSIAKSIRAIGGSGTIHGWIVDIDYFNHIYLNPNDGKITAYTDTSQVDKYVYENIQDLLYERTPALYDKYMQLLADEDGKNLLQIYIEPTGINKTATYDSDTSIYSASRKMKALQYTTNKNIVRVWHEQLVTEDPNLNEISSYGLPEKK